MPYPRPPRRVLAAAGILAALAAACHDSPSDPLSGITTVETAPSLAITREVPTLDRLAGGGAGSGELAEAVREWRASWDDPDGEVWRVAARARALPELHARTGDRGAQRALAELFWLRGETERHALLPAELRGPLDEARLLLDRGEAALEAGRGEEALGWALAAADRVRAVTSEAVARRLMGQGERLLADPPAEGVDVERARHLMNGAHRALAAGDYPLAIRRAYYARQVVEGRQVAPDTLAPGG
ncbi:MAG: hypothetical protein RQ751_11255 [Longimicrobiales bacterium]|nr:hypothetical protein [Longimicrobiales bacterium]